MLKLHTSTIAALLGGLLLASSAQAELAGVQFSADTISRGADGQTTTGKLYVGANRMRVELAHQGQNRVRIHDQTRQLEWMLLPEQQAYLERAVPLPNANSGQQPTPSAETNPCQGIAELTCQRVGEETVAGRQAIKWEMTLTRDGQTLTGAQWLDVERGLPLKYQMPDGQAMELRLLGNETVAGRTVEKWQMTTSLPNAQPEHALQWYDPQLKLAVREEFPNGFVRELTNIQIGPQADALFSVPAGYHKLESPAPQR
ncbi:hypothetical protein SAMN05421644_10510 [Allochromatium warmingii]|uniref:DUF4412 domain-containing protein n=1 Tax=Allochromatium warmingii TaxID=61595 RepID=A0A1H3C5G9_ALLWA|nr:hypothetical protein [Allochromatium warmingii]SDX49341.1 hypothetical protein SAMN05421644_10510 [Allochromatium warmingii]